MPKFREKRPAPILAHVWHKNGDHPDDNCHMVYPNPRSTTQFEPFLSEGKIVRCYRVPFSEKGEDCIICGNKLLEHGWIDTEKGGCIVCPGDWIVTEDTEMGRYRVVRKHSFEATYEPDGLPQPLIPRFYE